MKLWVRDGKFGTVAQAYFDKKISHKVDVRNSFLNGVRKIQIRKTGRLVDIGFSCKLHSKKSSFFVINFTEAEILYLAQSCRRNRTDEQFLKAIAVAGQPRKKFVPAEIHPSPDDDGELELDD